MVNAHSFDIQFGQSLNTIIGAAFTPSNTIGATLPNFSPSSHINPRFLK